MTEDNFVNTTDGLIQRMHSHGSSELAEFFQWFMDDIEIDSNNAVQKLPEAENAPIGEDLAEVLILSIIFGADLENEYPRRE